MAYREVEDAQVDAEFKQKINVEFLVLKQIDRCNNAAFEGDEIKFSNAVESLLAMLPKENRLRIENDKIKTQYETKIEQPVYKYSCGKPMGTLENPIYRNKKSDWNYDGGEPILVSPTVEEVTQTDYQKLYKIILNELQDVGVTWKIEPRGNVEKRIDPPAIPLLRLKDGKLIRVLIEKGISAVKEGIVKDEMEKQGTVGNAEKTGKPVNEPRPTTDTDSDPETEDDSEGEIGDGDDEGGEGETDSSDEREVEEPEGSNEENSELPQEVQEGNATAEDDTNNLSEEQRMEEFKQTQLEKKKRDIGLRDKRRDFERREKAYIKKQEELAKEQELADKKPEAQNVVKLPKLEESENKEFEKFGKNRYKKAKKDTVIEP